jgi:hypothetical protein
MTTGACHNATRERGSSGYCKVEANCGVKSDLAHNGGNIHRSTDAWQFTCSYQVII